MFPTERFITFFRNLRNVVALGEHFAQGFRTKNIPQRCLSQQFRTVEGVVHVCDRNYR